MHYCVSDESDDHPRDTQFISHYLFLRMTFMRVTLYVEKHILFTKCHKLQFDLIK